MSAIVERGQKEVIVE